MAKKMTIKPWQGLTTDNKGGAPARDVAKAKAAGFYRGKGKTPKASGKSRAGKVKAWRGK